MDNATITTIINKFNLLVLPESSGLAGSMFCELNQYALTQEDFLSLVATQCHMPGFLIGSMNKESGEWGFAAVTPKMTDTGYIVEASEPMSRTPTLAAKTEDEIAAAALSIIKQLTGCCSGSDYGQQP